MGLVSAQHGRAILNTEVWENLELLGLDNITDVENV